VFEGCSPAFDGELNSGGIGEQTRGRGNGKSIDPRYQVGIADSLRKENGTIVLVIAEVI
jgi:hypothetical protein